MGRAVDAAKAVFDARGVDIEIGVYANAFENLNDGEAANEGLHGTREDLNSDKYSTFAANGWKRARAWWAAAAALAQSISAGSPTASRREDKGSRGGGVRRAGPAAEQHIAERGGNQAEVEAGNHQSAVMIDAP